MPPLTLMVVHAHPDDEAISTGGILARYGDEGVRTVLVTCTDGSAGDGPGGVKPGEPGHDPVAVAGMRLQELERSCEALGVKHLEMLGYTDSGMMGWPLNDAPGSFWTTPVPEAAAKLAQLVHRYEPQVVVTYDSNGFYGHPDHIQAHRITMEAVESTGVPDKLYFTAVPKSWFAELGKRLTVLGIEFPSPEVSPEDAAVPAEDQSSGPEEWGTPDEEVTTVVDVGDVVDQKYESLVAHSSQSDNIFFLQMGREAFGEVMTREAFVRAIDRTEASLPEDDLFAGLR
ncbi:MAG TPA: PIG-L family deacetylase [Acidimicrobiales bacterium]|nr:PIG-L family deacetylase [Acidimicrobiales bacterium]